MENIHPDKVKEFKNILVLNRVRILELLSKNDTCVCQMVKNLSIKHSLVSHHLKTLQKMGYLSYKRNGQHIIYSLNKSKVKTINRLFLLLKT